MKKRGNYHAGLQDNPGGYIFDIQTYSIHDGPGIRTLVFFKGCPLACAWCSNPEGQAFSPQVRFQKHLCEAECEKCLKFCSREALSKRNGQMFIDFLSCRRCEAFTCAPACPKAALQVCGYYVDCETLIEKVSKDSPFFAEDGGVTISGGEPFAQPEFLTGVVKRCKEIGISTAVETCLHAPFEHIERALPFIDFFMFDIKLIDYEKHASYCGLENDLIIQNITELSRIAKIPLLPRMPIIPSVNDSLENIRTTAAFLNKLGFEHLNLVLYMRLGIDKYEQLGMHYTMKEITVPSNAYVKNIVENFAAEGITCL